MRGDEQGMVLCLDGDFTKAVCIQDIADIDGWNTDSREVWNTNIQNYGTTPFDEWNYSGGGGSFVVDGMEYEIPGYQSEGYGAPSPDISVWPG